jgi:asparagine N-glycosylation enzyme membrane subunit Stt3
VNKPSPYWFPWLLFSFISAAVAMLYTSAAVVDGQYIPVGNDSFYHARRIIDAAIGARGFYQFDTMIHVPEGSWLSWPWAFDWLMALALRVALWIRPEMQPMKFLAYVPVIWVFVNAGLMTLIARQVRLSAAATAIALLAFSLLPLTQNLHGLGLIDHHFIELTFVLLTVLFGLRFFERQGNKDAVILGAILGAAVAFHNGLFILQVPVLAAVLLLWLRAEALPQQGLLRLAATLFVTTVLVVLPSAPFYDMQFEFWTLSWFHVYIAFGSAVVLAFVALRPCDKTNVGILAAIGIAVLMPMFARLVTGATFLSGELDIISNISEVKSPISRLLGPGGVAWVTSLYGWLILVAPALLVLHGFELLARRKPEAVYLSVFIVFGIAMLLAQYRLHPFGAWAIIIGGVLAVERLRHRLGASTLVTTAVTLAILAVALQPPLRNQLFVRVPPGLDRDYAASRSLYPALATACDEAPGTVLALADDGHPIRYHTDCSVIVNNFLMTPLHAQKLAEVDTYLRMTPQELVRDTDIRYLFVRLNNVFFSGPGGVEPTPIDVIKDNNSRLFFRLAFAKNVPSNFRLLAEVRVDDERDFAFGRVFEIVRDE